MLSRDLKNEFAEYTKMNGETVSKWAVIEHSYIKYISSDMFETAKVNFSLLTVLLGTKCPNTQPKVRHSAF